jgi:hypothetical protein
MRLKSLVFMVPVTAVVVLAAMRLERQPPHVAVVDIVGTIFDGVHLGRDPGHALSSVQPWGVPAESGAVLETAFAPDGSGVGSYAFVTHPIVAATKAVAGVITVAPVAPAPADR